MTKKQTPPASELLFLDELPPYLREETAKFISRNKIDRNNFCPQCLKAYLFGKADEKGMDFWVWELINLLIPEQLGHNKYYLDEGELEKINF